MTRFLTAWRERGFTWRLLLPVFVLVGVGVVAHVWLHLQTAQHEYRLTQTAALDDFSRLIAPLIVERVRANDLSALGRDFDRWVMESTAIRSITWRGLQGAPVVATDDARDTRAPRWFRMFIVFPVIERTYRVARDDVLYGELTLVLSPGDSEYRLWRQLILSSSGGLLLFVLLTGAILLVARDNLLSIQQLGNAARQLARGHTRTPIAMPSSPDIRDVVVAFNDMAARIDLLLDNLSAKERALAEQRHFTEELIDAIPIPVFYTNRGGGCIGVNHAWEQFFGMSRDHVRGKRVSDLYGDNPSAATYHQHQDEALFACPGTQFYESRLTLGNGTARDVLFSKATFTTPEGEVAGIIGAVTDLTALNEAQELAAAARVATASTDARVAALKAFVDHFSHEMRTPLAAIINLVDLVRSADNPDKRGQYLSHLYSATIHLREMVNNVLDMAQLDAGRLVLTSTPFPVADLVADIARIGAALVAPRGEAVRLNVESTGLRPGLVVQGDALRLRQAVTNLLAYAIKRLPCGSISLKASCRPGDASGVALQFDITEHASEDTQTRFCSSTPLAHDPGAGGLGQVITQQLIALMDGTLTVDDRVAARRHTTLTVPLMTVGSASNTAVAARGRACGITIAVVDDDPLTRYYLSELLVQGGYICTTASDRDGAVRLFDDGCPSLAIIDYRLGNDDGLALARELRERFPWCQLPVVLLTADVSASLPDDWSRHVDALLTKPVTPSELFSFIDQLAGEPTMEPHPDPQPVLLDRAMLDRVTRGITNPGFLGQFLDQFITSTDAGLEDMRKALGRADYETVRRLAHRQKGSARQVGASALAAQWLACEQATDEDLARTGTARLSAATAVYAQTRSAIAAYRAATDNGVPVGGDGVPIP